jgi:hypothetical protein
MNLVTLSIKHFNNNIAVKSTTETEFVSSWYMEFGKFISEVFDKDEKVIYTMTKQFQFWKWRMVYHIRKNGIIVSELISQNNRKTIYAVALNELFYEIKINYKKRFSIYKNRIKIAEIDESFTDIDFKDEVKILLLDKNDLEISFLLFSCLKIGETDQRTKGLLTSQKQLEINDEPWC